MNQGDMFDDMLTSRHAEMLAEFRAFHIRHPQVFSMFCQFALEKMSQGFKNYAAATIFERVRWETPLGDDGNMQFKLNNNHRAFYTRMFEARYPQYEGFLRKRQQKSKDDPALNLRPLAPGDFE